MKYLLLLTTGMLLCIASFGQKASRFKPVISLGTRNTFSAFNSDEAFGKGIGGQTRVQLGKRLNTEWFLDYITSKTTFTSRNDYHVGWSLMFYFKNNYDFTHLFQPYILAGHCFDKTQVFELNNRSNQASRWSMATQAGVGTHINITPKFDCSLACQYMLHFGKDIESDFNNDKLVIQKTDHTNMDGHLLASISFNYKIFPF